RFPSRIGTHRERRHLFADLGDRDEGRVVEVERAAMIGRADRIGVPDDVVAVRLRGLDILVADGTAAARPLHRDHALRKVFRHEFRQKLADGLCGRSEKDRHLDGLLWKLCLGDAALADRKGQRRRPHCQCSRQSAHALSPFVVMHALRKFALVFPADAGYLCFFLSQGWRYDRAQASRITLLALAMTISEISPARTGRTSARTPGRSA